MNEFELIARLTASLPSNPAVVTGVGDDCAVLDVGAPGRRLLFKTDAIVEGIHFLPTADPRKIGHKALGRCLSDIAAMGGRPLAALITLALPSNFEVPFVSAIYDGMNALARRYGVAIVGGETTTNPERMLISVSMLGECSNGILRSGAKSGDAIFVTGELGGSILGKHLEFEPRVAEGQWLAEHFPIHAMIDISDGLVNDLRHILKASGVGAELLAKSIPVSPAARQRCSKVAPLWGRPPVCRFQEPLAPWTPTDFGAAPAHKRACGSEPTVASSPETPLMAALGDGEDFELLLCVSGKQAVPLLDAWKKQFPALRLTCIGKIRPEPGLSLRDKTGIHTLESHGYVHFA